MIKAGIVGGTGYTGIELLRLLLGHPCAGLNVVTSRSEVGKFVRDVYPSLRGRISLRFATSESPSLNECDVVFFATPHGVAMDRAEDLSRDNVKLIDLGADFRLQSTSIFEKYYGIPHRCPNLLKKAVYGLPELNRSDIKNAHIIGNPGCYPTTIQIGLAPLLREKVINTTSQTIADCKSGISGAGRKEKLALLFSEASENFRAYQISEHRHVPEILENLSRLTNEKIDLLFVPHIVPMARGMYSTIYVPLIKALSPTDLQEIFMDAYRDEPFIDVMPIGSYPETRFTRGSNMLQIALHCPKKDVAVVLVSQDNLVKGAAGQAVQCMNLMFGLEETTGLLCMPTIP